MLLVHTEKIGTDISEYIHLEIFEGIKFKKAKREEKKTNKKNKKTADIQWTSRI